MIRPAITLLGILLFVAVVSLLLPGTDGPLVRTRLLMGTVTEIRILDPDAEQFDAAVTAAFAEMERIEALMSPHRPDSEVSLLSLAKKQRTVSADLRRVLQTSINVASASAGAFDAGLGRLVRLWGFAEGNPQVPTKAEIDRALVGTGPGALTIVDDTLVKRQAQLAIDLGGVAKGYAIDRAIQILAAAGVRHASVNAGGDLQLLGDRAGTGWRIGIQHPRRKDGILARLELADTAVVTSGDYERYFEQDGVRYHHILDPRSGYPATSCQAVTVIAGEAMLADALATAVFVLGPEQGLPLLARFSADGIIVSRDGSVVTTPGLKGKVEWP